ncbi:MAG: hypothetical protein HY673_13590 [Chloroflexi bacterium]|nr:hypothetical protein [Chloroflexota bacterium]
MKRIFCITVLTLIGMLPQAWVAEADPLADLQARIEAMERQYQAEIKGLREQVASLTQIIQTHSIVRETAEEPSEASREEGIKTTLNGQYRMVFNSSNFSFHPAAVGDDQKSESFVALRFRPTLNTVINENLRAQLMLEMGHINWGEDGELTKNYTRGNDDIGVEVRRAFLEFRMIPQVSGLHPIQFKVGIQDWTDGFGDVLASSDWDFNVGGIQGVTQVGPLGLKLGYFKLFEGNTRRSDDSDLYAVDTEYHFSKSSQAGFHLYWMDDKSNKRSEDDPRRIGSTRKDVWLGLDTSTALGALGLKGFAIFNAGKENGDGGRDICNRGWAFKLEGSYRIGAARVSLQGLYATGEDGSSQDRSSRTFRTIGQSVRDGFGAQGYWSYLGIFTPHGPSDTNDLGVSLQNRGYGLTTVQGKVEFPITGRLDGYLAGGWLRSSAENPRGDQDMGFEFLAEGRYNLGSLFSGLSRKLDAGVYLEFGSSLAFLGDFYRFTLPDDPDNLFQFYSRLQMEF